MSSDPKEEQLLNLIKGYRGIEGFTGYPGSLRVELFGVIVEYVGSSTTHGLEEVLKTNPLLANLFSTNVLPNQTKMCTSLLDSLIRGEQEFRSLLKFSGRMHFSALRRMLLERKSCYALHYKSPEDHVGFEVHSIIWQLSDIHFGPHCTEKNLAPETLANRLARLADQFPDYAPNLVVVSGDLTSQASVDEFDLFKRFVNGFNKRLWGPSPPDRFLIVPGNHDIKWDTNGKTDKMKGFRESLGDEGFITPFGAEEYVSTDKQVKVRRYSENHLPPITEVSLKDMELTVLLLNSAYYSGEVPLSVREKVREALSKPDDQIRVMDAIREDKGEFTEDYVTLLEKKISLSDRTGIAMTHHHMCQIGRNINANPQATRLLTKLAEKGIRLILHGHVHLFAGKAQPVIGNEAYPIPCSTLSGINDPSSAAGFCVHCFGKPEETRNFATLNWPIDPDRQFDPELLTCRYKFRISKDNIE